MKKQSLRVIREICFKISAELSGENGKKFQKNRLSRKTARLMKLGIFCVMPEQYNERLAVTYSATERDAALFISYSGGTIPFLKTELGVLRRAHCRTILLSTLDQCEGIDHFIVIPAREQTRGKAAGYYSQTAIRYILNCLYGMIYAADLPKHRKRKDRAEGVEE